MKKFDKCFIILFFICMVLLLYYLLSLRISSPLPTYIFWITVIPAILILVFQITRDPWPGYGKIIVLEILIWNTVLILFYKVSYYGFRYTDPYGSMMIIRRILQHGVVPPDILNYWPLFNILGGELCGITGISAFTIVKWFPILISVFFLLLFYVFTKKVFNNERVALLTMLLMATLYSYLFYFSCFHYEKLAQIIMLTMFYFLIRSTQSKRYRIEYTGLSILCVIGVIYAHHFTSLLVLIFLIIIYVTVNILKTFNNNSPILSKKESILGVTGVFIQLTSVGVLSYWIHVCEQPLEIIVEWSNALIYGDPRKSTGVLEYGTPVTLPTIRAEIIFYGFFLFTAIFFIILLYNFCFRRSDKPIEFFLFTIFLFLMGTLGMLSYFVTPKGLCMHPGRLNLLGWIWGFAPLVICILKSKREWGKKIGIAILTAFLLFNMYQMPGELVDSQVFKEAEPIGSITTLEDYAVARTIAFTGNVSAYHKTRLAIWDIQGFYCRELCSVTSINQLEAVDWIVIKKEQLESYKKRGGYGLLTGHYGYPEEVVNKLVELLRGVHYGERDKIYDSNNLAVLK